MEREVYQQVPSATSNVTSLAILVRYLTSSRLGESPTHDGRRTAGAGRGAATKKMFNN